MSDEAADFDSSPERIYYLALEKVFIAERGAPLALSEKDYRVARDWHGAGIPLDWLERRLREICAERRERGTFDKMTGLTSCRPSVDAAWRRQMKLAAPVTDLGPAIEIGPRLEALARALPAELPDRKAWSRRLTALAEHDSIEAVEEKLHELDREILAAASVALPPALGATLDSDVARATARLAKRLSAAALEPTRTQLRERRLRELLVLPTLSLFAAEADPAENGSNT